MRVAIIGGAGYTGVELMRLLCRHPHADITLTTSRQFAGTSVASVYPSLGGFTSLVYEDLPVAQAVEKADFFFTAVPHQTAMAIVPPLLAAGKKVVDLSADFRLRDAAVYEAWYQPHTAQELLAEAVYGLPEIHRERIRTARLVANPGCYPTSAILGLAPLLRGRAVAFDTIIVDSKSGVSGAGRSAAIGSLFCEVSDGFKAYKVGQHRHTPEIEQELGLLAGGQELRISFTPHLVPMSRGILSTIYARLAEPLTDEQVFQLYRHAYEGERFVRVLAPGSLPATQYVRGSNFCDLGFKVDQRTGRIVIVAVIDNLGKGAASQALQNMNVMCGFPEDEGLGAVALFP